MKEESQNKEVKIDLQENSPADKKQKTKPKKIKKKKEKKILGVPVNINMGKKIKDIEMDSSKYKIANLIFLILLNVALIAVMIYFLTVIYNVMILIIALFTIILCLVWSICTYILSMIKIKYTVYEFAIVKNFDTSKNIGEFEKLIGYKKKTSFIDRIGKNKTSTLVLKFSNKWCPKISLTCISEDIDNLINELRTLANYSSHQPQKRHKKEKTLKQKIELEIENAPKQSKLSREQDK